MSPSKEISTNPHFPKKITFHDFDEQMFFSNQFVDEASTPPQKKRKGEIALGASPSKEISTNSRFPKKKTFHDFNEQIFFSNQFVDVASIPPQRRGRER